MPIQKLSYPTEHSPSLTAEHHYAGLCSLCQRQSDCTFLTPQHQSVRFCDEFSGEEYEQKENDSLTAESSHPSLPENAQATGLCRLCDKFLSCAYPKPRSGIWHCEEYE